MKLRSLFLASTFAALIASSAVAQEEPAGFDLPKACQQAGHMVGNMGGMGQMGDVDAMQHTMGGQMNDATKGYMQAIVGMHPPMVQGAMAADADLAFFCSMIAHHKGAIAMARVQLEHGKDEEARKMAQKMIDEQSKEVEVMTKWVGTHAK